jgi:hypothetical protein
MKTGEGIVIDHNLAKEVAERRIVSLQEAAELSSLSVDTLQRRHSDKILKLSVRRRGMRLGDVLRLGQSGPAAA